MELNNHDQARIREYLLGKLNDDDQQRIEERLMVEDDLFEEFEVSKGELVEDYRAGELSRREREWFEQHFLASTEGKQQHTFAIALEKLKRPNAIPQQETLFERLQNFFGRSWVTLAKATSVAVLLIVGGVTLLTRIGQQPAFVPLTLTSSSLSRSGGPAPARVSLPPNVQELRIFLTLPKSNAGSAVSYSAELDDTNEIKPVRITGHDANSVFLVIPAAQLSRGQYALKLFATAPDGEKQPVGTYFFDVE